MIYLIVFVLIYLLVTVYLSYLGYRRTVTVSDYLLAGRQMHPFVMAMGYVSAAISTSAIIGFGGVSGVYGLSLMWLSCLNIVVGIWVAYILFGKRTRKMGKALDAHTFPELLGRRYESRFIQGFAGLVILTLTMLRHIQPHAEADDRGGHPVPDDPGSGALAGQSRSRAD